MGKHSPIAEAPRYMHEFRCTGSACPENCCTGWNVSIDKPSYQLYRDVRREPLAGLIREGLERVPGAGHALNLLRMTETRRKKTSLKVRRLLAGADAAFRDRVPGIEREEPDDD